SRLRSVLEKELFDVKIKSIEARKVGSFYIVTVEIFLDPKMPIYKAYAVKRKIDKISRRESELVYHVDVRIYPDESFKKKAKRPTK
ncbi:MAG: hypothetical protein QW148_06800, partial [Thermosphaera sp.]